jgi:hypothetical protein
VKTAPDELKHERKTGDGEYEEERSVGERSAGVEEEPEEKVRSDAGERQRRRHGVSARR